MEQDQYVGWDVHQASTSFAVLDSGGRLVEEGVLATEPERLVGWVSGLGSRVHLTFEERPYAAWLYELIEPLVAELVVANARRHLGTVDVEHQRFEGESPADPWSSCSTSQQDPEWRLGPLTEPNSAMGHRAPDRSVVPILRKPTTQSTRPT